MHRVSYVGVLLFFWKGWVWGVCIGGFFFNFNFFNFLILGRMIFHWWFSLGMGWNRMGMVMVMVIFGGMMLLLEGGGSYRTSLE